MRPNNSPTPALPRARAVSEIATSDGANVPRVTSSTPTGDPTGTPRATGMKHAQASRKVKKK
jgi:hypothetical protein